MRVSFYDMFSNDPSPRKGGPFYKTRNTRACVCDGHQFTFFLSIDICFHFKVSFLVSFCDCFITFSRAYSARYRPIGESFVTLSHCDEGNLVAIENEVHPVIRSIVGRGYL
jgi:hypothetical protein